MSNSKSRSRNKSGWTKKRKPNLGITLGLLTLLAFIIGGGCIAILFSGPSPIEEAEIAENDTNAPTEELLVAEEEVIEPKGASELERIIFRHLHATNVNEVTTMKLSASLNAADGEGHSAEHQVTFYFRRPNLARRIMEHDGMRYDMGYNGHELWAQQYAPNGATRAVEDIPETQKELFSESARIGSYLWEFEKGPSNFRLLPESNLGGIDCYVVLFEKADLRVKTYIDKANFLEVGREESNVGKDGNLRKNMMVMSDHRNVEGVVMPFAIESSSNGFVSRVIVESISINSGVPSYIFDAPVERFAEVAKTAQAIAK
ncbi:MAG: hypothetical protein AAFX93_17640 [Verrucomicrobiota bacterium]